ncbi:aldo/keto reductase [Halobaculum sp. MBLA0147]|uniref:aldo/keto reductase n=1 Tax=Halobaculum sp. MBLA0147 TaxID=3079934 RepID=UPI003524B7BD
MGYGAMRLCAEGIVGAPDDEEHAREVARRAIEYGVDFVDTADSYGPGVSERLLRESGIVDDAVVATKAGLLRNADTEWLAHGDPDYLKNQALVSRDRLGVDSIDLLQLHRPDPDTPFADSVTALAELVDEGLVEHVGLSNVTVEQLDEAREIVDVVSVQNRYNVGYRDEQPVLDACERSDVAFLPWYPMAAGDLDEVAADLDAVADAHDATRHQIALAWLLHTSDVTVPIPGTGDLDHLADNVAAAEIDLDESEVRRLDEAI